MDEYEKILCRIIMEVVGTPKEHVEKSLRAYAEKIKKEGGEAGIKVLKEDIVDAEKKGEFWSTFAELEAEFRSISDLAGFCFDYMPASIEIIEPSSINYKSQDLTAFFNELQAKLHRVDMLVKNLRAEKAILNRNVINLTKNAITTSLKESPKKIEEISADVGIKPEQLKPFIDDFLKKRILIEKEGIYSNALSKSRAA